MQETKLLVGHKIRATREVQGISQEFLASKLKVSQTTMSKIENGELKVSFDQVCEIAEVLGIDVNAIINFDKSFIFNSCTQSGCFNNYAFNGVEEVKQLYEKLLTEKEAQIQLLREMTNK